MFDAKRMILNLKAHTGIRTTKELAEKIGVPYVTVSYMEKTNNPKINTLLTIANGSGLGLDVLVRMGVVEDS